MSLTNNKLKSNLREKLIKRQEQEKSKGGNDPRFLNYFDLPDDSQMEIIFLADGGDTGEIMVDFEKHGKGLKIRGAGTVNCCYTSSGEACPACDRSFGYHEAGDDDSAKMWRRQTYSVAQCVVVRSPIEINESEDGNIAKLMHLPWAIHEKIIDDVINQIVDDPTEHIFVIKKTKNAGGRASYEKSFFKPKPYALDDLPEELVEAIDNGKLKPYTFADEVPAPTTAAEVQEWMDKVDGKIANNADETQAAPQTETKPQTQESPEQETASTNVASSGSTLRDRLARRRAASQE